MRENQRNPTLPMERIGLWVAGLVLIALASCRHVPADVAAPRPQATDKAAATLETGRAIYVSESQCAKCHSPKPVYEHGAQKWAEKILPAMAKKAKLSQPEYDAVLAYVTSPVGQTPPTPAAR